MEDRKTIIRRLARSMAITQSKMAAERLGYRKLVARGHPPQAAQGRFPYPHRTFEEIG